jgi:hypothetical protein
MVALGRETWERRLNAEEFDAWVNAPMTPEDRDDLLSFIAWFNRRYPTPADRLRAARRQYKNWTRGIPR